MQWGKVTLIALCGLMSGCGGSGSPVYSTPPPAPTITYTPPVPGLPASSRLPMSLAHVRENIEWTDNQVTSASIEHSAGYKNAMTVHYEGDGKYTVGFSFSETEGESLPYQNAVTQGGFDTYQKGPTERIPENRGYASSLSLFRSVDSPLKFQYLSYGIWEQHQVSGAKRDGLREWFVFGHLTHFAAQPTTGSATYHGIFDGDWVGGGKVTRLGGTGTFGIDFATLSQNGTILIDQPDGLGGRKNFDTVSFDHNIDQIIKSKNGLEGYYIITFGGPKAEEVALNLVMEKSNIGIVNGVFLGKQQ